MEVIAFAVGGCGLAYGAWSRYHLWKWARECRGTRVSIAYKRKVKVDAPLVEWMLWGRQAARDKDKAGSARMVFSAGGTSVMVVQRVRATTKWQVKLARWKESRGKQHKDQASVGHNHGGRADGQEGGPGPGQVADERGQA